ncbi:outer membrane beta-barrel protein [Mucilaginibacter paludis]|nr:outer membrane beta-barrel protein [Mucilaginibacter paludis]
MLFGVKYGIVYESVSKFYDKENFKSLSLPGAHLGLFVSPKSPFTNVRYVIGLNYSKRLYKILNKNNLDISNTYSSTFFEIPINIQYKIITKKLYFDFNLGPTFSCWKSYSIKQSIPDIYNTNITKDNQEIVTIKNNVINIELNGAKYNRLQIGASAGVGFGRRIDKRIDILADVNLQKSLSGQLKNSQYQRKSSLLLLDLGVIYSIY